MFSLDQARIVPLCFLSLCAFGQASKPAAAPATRQQEDNVIAENRKGAKPREVAKGKSLTSLEQERARVFRTARKSVVYINASTNVPMKNLTTGDVFRIPPGTGTGFVWDDLGHVVTNHHVITVDDPNGIPRFEAENLSVRLADGQEYKARVIGRSLSNDIAVLQVFAPLKDLTPLPLGSSKDLIVGQSVLAIGNPFGLDHTLTSGIVSALGRVIPSSFLTLITGVIQTDAAINPGNSGGPLLDSNGRLLGMNTAIPAVTGANVGIGFAIPVDTLNQIVPKLIAGGQMERPALGFTSMPRLLAIQIFEIDKGIVVWEVTPNSLAARAGLKGLTDQGAEKKPLLGDVITSFQGKPIQTDIELLDRLDLLPPETPLVFEVLRDGKTITITLRPQEKGPEVKANIPV